MLSKSIYLIIFLAFISSKCTFAQNNTIIIGNQEWAKKNLSTEFFRNGDKITQAKSFKEIKEAEKSKTPLWWYYDFNPKNDVRYGKMYNWWAVIDQRGLAPSGFKIPNQIEFEDLIAYTERKTSYLKSKTGWGNIISGGPKRIDCPNCKNWSDSYKLKTACHKCKDNRYIDIEVPERQHSNNGIDKYGFNGLPGGTIHCVSIDMMSFNDIGYDCIYWSPQDNYGVNEVYNARDYYLGGEKNRIDAYSIDNFNGKSHYQVIGAYIRCIKANVIVSKENYETGELRVLSYSSNGQVDSILSFHKNGQKQFKAQIKNDQLNGFFYSYLNDRIVIEGQNLNNQKDGNFKYYDNNGYLTKIVIYQGDKVINTTTFEYYPNSSKIQKKTEEAKDKKSEYQYYENGNIKMEGTSTFGQKRDFWREYYETGQIKNTVQYYNGKTWNIWYYSVDGKNTMRKTNTNILDWNNLGVETWEIETFYPNEKLKEKYYLTGDVNDSTYTLFYENGNQKEILNYEKGLLDGPFRYFDLNQNIYKKGQYKDGKLSGTIEYYFSDGKLEHLEQFIDGIPYGTWIYYDQNGKKIKKIKY